MEHVFHPMEISTEIFGNFCKFYGKRPLFLICVRTKSISEPGNSICIRSASMFDSSIANPNSTLVLLASFYFATPKTPRSCRTIPIPLARPFKQYRYHLARPVEQIEIHFPYNLSTNKPFYSCLLSDLAYEWLRGCQ